MRETWRKGSRACTLLMVRAVDDLYFLHIILFLPIFASDKGQAATGGQRRIVLVCIVFAVQRYEKRYE